MKKIITLFLVIFTITSCDSCKECTSTLADLVLKQLRSSKTKDQNGNISITLGETVSFTTSILNEFAEGKCKDNTENAGESKLKALVNILNKAGTVLGTIDTLYLTKSISKGSIDDVISKLTFLQSGYYELEFQIDANGDVRERNENNNTIEAFNVLWQFLQIILGKNTQQPNIIQTSKGFAIKVGTGEINQAILDNALLKNDFHEFVHFE